MSDLHDFLKDIAKIYDAPPTPADEAAREIEKLSKLLGKQASLDAAPGGNVSPVATPAVALAGKEHIGIA